MDQTNSIQFCCVWMWHWLTAQTNILYLNFSVFLYSWISRAISALTLRLNAVYLTPPLFPSHRPQIIRGGMQRTDDRGQRGTTTELRSGAQIYLKGPSRGRGGGGLGPGHCMHPRLIWQSAMVVMSEHEETGDTDYTCVYVCVCVYTHIRRLL